MTPRVNASPLLRALFAGRDHDSRLQHVLEQMPAAFLALPRTGSVLAVNGRAAVLTEWTRDELLRRALAEIVAAPAAAEALALIHELEPGESRSVPGVPLQTRSGRAALADLRLSAFSETVGGEPLVLILAVPAEERLAQEREEAQRRQAVTSIEHLLALFNDPDETALEQALPLIQDLLGADAVALYQVAHDQPGMRLLHATVAGLGFPPVLGPSEAQFLQTPWRWSSSQRAEGYLAQAARGAGWSALLAQPVGDPPYIVAALCAAYQPGNPPSALAAQWLVVAAQHLHQLTALIGRRQDYARARELAVRLNAQVAAINAQVTEGVLLLNRDGTLDGINGAAARMLGYRSEDVTGLAVEDVVIGEGRLTQGIYRTLAHPEGTLNQECRLLRRSGESFPAEIRLRALPDGGGVLTIRDMSEVRANEMRQEHLDQLAYVGQATQAFAHEVRNPLNNIAMGVQYLAADLKPEGDVAETLRKIQNECTRLSGLMNDMLAWAKPVHPQLQPTYLDPLLRRVINRFSLKVERANVKLNYTADGNCPPVMADARLLEPVFVNLIDNALQAMPAGGHLSLSLGYVHRGSSGTMVEARVADSGPGLTEEVKRQVFDPYFTTKPDGTGLGLAICKRLVTINRGAIGVESFPGAGTVFTVTLPAIPSPGAAESLDKDRSDSVEPSDGAIPPAAAAVIDAALPAAAAEMALPPERSQDERNDTAG